MTSQSSLPARYEIRVLAESDLEWTQALTTHCGAFHSIMKPYFQDKPQLVYQYHGVRQYAIGHVLASGYCTGIFDKEYKFKRPESAASGGKLYWDLESDSADPKILLEQMDFPLVSVALAFDSKDPFDPEKMKPAMDTFPFYIDMNKALEALDRRDKATWEAKERGEVLFRGGSATRADYEGRGLMAALARDQMGRSAKQGFRAIQIDCAHETVRHVWATPPAPFKPDIVAEFHTKDWGGKDEAGNTKNPLQPFDAGITRVYLHLKSDS